MHKELDNVMPMRNTLVLNALTQALEDPSTLTLRMASEMLLQHFQLDKRFVTSLPSPICLSIK